MIIHKDCNIFDGGAQGIIHQANCQNTMGSGIAREIRARYPEAYEVDCKTIAGDYKKLGTFSSVKTNDGKFVIYNTQHFDMVRYYNHSPHHNCFHY